MRDPGNSQNRADPSHLPNHTLTHKFALTGNARFSGGYQVALNISHEFPWNCGLGIRLNRTEGLLTGHLQNRNFAPEIPCKPSFCDTPIRRVSKGNIVEMFSMIQTEFAVR